MLRSIAIAFVWFMALMFYCAGLLIWPLLRWRRGRDAVVTKLRGVFLVTLSVLICLGLVVIALAFLTKFSWDTVMILFPLINLGSLFVSTNVILEGRDNII